MKKYLVSVNCKFDIINSIDNQIIETCEPLQVLRRLFAGYVIQRGNSVNWNIALWHSDTNTHLYYVVNPK